MTNAFYNNSTTLVQFTLASAADVEDKFDEVEAGFDLIEAEVENAIKLSNADVTTDQEITDAAAVRAGKTIGFDTNGDLELKTPTESMIPYNLAFLNVVSTSNAYLHTSTGGATGWAVEHTATGHFTITHPWGGLLRNIQATVDENSTPSEKCYAVISEDVAGTLEIKTYNESGTLVDAPFYVAMTANYSATAFNYEALTITTP